MSVDDHGLEVLKKAAIPLDPSKPKSEYVLRVTAVPSAGGTGFLTTEKTAISISALQINTWVTVPLAQVNNIATVETFDNTDMVKVLVEWRIVGGTQVQIRSANALTYTVHTIGYIN